MFGTNRCLSTNGECIFPYCDGCGFDKPEEEMSICEICGSPIQGDDPHFFHNTDCPNFNRDPGENIIPCTCDHIAHPECCPECV